jgi:hypothetical protein
MLIGESFHIEELYAIFKDVGRFTGWFTVRAFRKEIQKKQINNYDEK